MVNQAEYNELTALQRLSEGDGTAFDQLFHANWDHVYSAAFTMTKSADLADDIAQETFISLWRDRQNLHEIKNLKAFLYTHVKFQVHKVFRRMKVEDAFAMYLRHKISVQSHENEQESSMAVKELELSLQRGVERLSPQQQRAFRLSREQGLTHEDISKLMGVSKKTVKDYIVRSLAFLRPYLDHYGVLVILAGSIFNLF
ncbi:MAG: sigma-70 family RNA polymerase sigma factor [Chitinophagaceae bacterium]|nr:MAG: sigma-70 family RNA polymerase sigma factor [Chitinophagaceae bacterium]